MTGDQAMPSDAADAYVEAIASDWRQAPLAPPDYALCVFAEKVTLHQHDLSPADLDTLRTYGFDDRAIHDATQVIAYFNYITRIADALGVEPESFVKRWGQSKY